MRLECPSCHKTVSPALSISAADVGMTCPACNAQIPRTALDHAVTDDEAKVTIPMPFVKELRDAAAAAVAAKEASVAPPAPPPPAPREDICPKCTAQLKPGLEACASCGLAVARWQSFSTERDNRVPEALRTAWDRVVENWDDEARHDALFQLVAELGEYGWAAGRYREQLRERALEGRPGDPIATKQMERIRRALEVTLMIGSTKRDKGGASPYRGVFALLGLLIFVLAVGMFYVFIKSRSAPDEQPQTMSRPPQVR